MSSVVDKSAVADVKLGFVIVESRSAVEEEILCLVVGSCVGQELRSVVKDSAVDDDEPYSVVGFCVDEREAVS